MGWLFNSTTGSETSVDRLYELQDASETTWTREGSDEVRRHIARRGAAQTAGDVNMGEGTVHCSVHDFSSIFFGSVDNK
jgi:hypothetical protein